MPPNWILVLYSCSNSLSTHTHAHDCYRNTAARASVDRRAGGPTEGMSLIGTANKVECQYWNWCAAYRVVTLRDAMPCQTVTGEQPIACSYRTIYVIVWTHQDEVIAYLVRAKYLKAAIGMYVYWIQEVLTNTILDKLKKRLNTRKYN